MGDEDSPYAKPSAVRNPSQDVVYATLGDFSKKDDEVTWVEVQDADRTQYATIRYKPPEMQVASVESPAIKDSRSRGLSSPATAAFNTVAPEMPALPKTPLPRRPTVHSSKPVNVGGEKVGEEADERIRSESAEPGAEPGVVPVDEKMVSRRLSSMRLKNTELEKNKDRERIPPQNMWLHGQLQASTVESMMLSKDDVKMGLYCIYETRSRPGYALAFVSTKDKSDPVLKHFFIECVKEKQLTDEGSFSLRERAVGLWRYAGAKDNYQGEYNLSVRGKDETIFYRVKRKKETGKLYVVPNGEEEVLVPVFEDIHDLVAHYKKEQNQLCCKLTEDCTLHYRMGARTYYTLDDIIGRYMEKPLTQDQILVNPFPPLDVEEPTEAPELTLPTPNYSIKMKDDKSSGLRGLKKMTIKIDLPNVHTAELVKSELRVCHDKDVNVDFLRLVVPGKYELEVPFKPFRVAAATGESTNLSHSWSRLFRRLSVSVPGLTQ